ncbi:glycerophosphodiester phosphodiesterase family protein [Anaeromicropila herbilytica]|uniref:GP-PDE domain-containing protein n=1 Tax=Anaeromicropila herbilytica TaxID=2785025 RepID=A0A7R7EHR6_9FIRM|nr:glycerophosphodiester phosphodiesterase family protein [Anaeromicropila herbilytica]BCN28906.1 hypothetical protein bsdtb5_02010 [Anaeromicropila herbilytica]
MKRVLAFTQIAILLFELLLFVPSMKTNANEGNQKVEFTAFDTNDLVAHALGGLENKYIYSNSLEGLRQSIEKGYKLIETDLILTKDGRLVCFHGWNQATYKNTGLRYDQKNPIMTYKEFISKRIQGKFTTIDISTIVDYLATTEDIYFVFDLRTLTKKNAIKTAEQIKVAFKNKESLTDRVIIQVGSKEMYEGIDSVYHFPHYQYFVHNEELKELDQLLQWVKDTGIIAVSIHYESLTPPIISKVKSYGLYLLTHTIDDIAKAKELLNSGVDIVCTNFITKNELDSFGKD